MGELPGVGRHPRSPGALEGKASPSFPMGRWLDVAESVCFFHLDLKYMSTGQNVHTTAKLSKSGNWEEEVTSLDHIGNFGGYPC